MSLAEGQKALQTFHEWCDAQGIEYDKEVRLVSRAFRDAPHRRSRDGFSSAVPGVVPPPVRSPPTPSSSSTPTVTARPGAGDSRVRGRLLREPEPVPLRRVRAARHRGGRSGGSLHPQERVSQRANVVVRAAAPGGAAGRGPRAEHRHHARALVTGKEQVARVLRRAPTPRRAHVTDVLAERGVTNAARHGARRARRGGCNLAARGLRRARRERAVRQVPGGVRSFTLRERFRVVPRSGVFGGFARVFHRRRFRRGARARRRRVQPPHRRRERARVRRGRGLRRRGGRAGERGGERGDERGGERGGERVV